MCNGSGQDVTQPPHTHGHPICRRCWGTGTIIEGILDGTDWFPANKTIMVSQDAYDALRRERDQLKVDNERLQKANSYLRKLAAHLEQLTDLALFTNELMASEEFADLYLRWQGFDPEQIGKDMQQIALNAMRKAQGGD